MTNCGKRILIQITSDVMNVRKPLLSTSALKHRGVTIIFNHDYDRIIFRNETVNLVSHDCHSYLHITLTNGVPPRRALVMAGESAANDVDEEVYGNDGAERHEAQEASAGDRRAIADADQAGQLDISGKTKTARIVVQIQPLLFRQRRHHCLLGIRFHCESSTVTIVYTSVLESQVVTGIRGLRASPFLITTNFVICVQIFFKCRWLGTNERVVYMGYHTCFVRLMHKQTSLQFATFETHVLCEYSSQEFCEISARCSHAVHRPM